MQNLQIFENADLGKFRIIQNEQGEPLFVAADICRILDLNNVTMALQGLDDDEKLTSTLLISGQNRQVWLLTEAGFYSLVLRSNKPEAKAFKRWVTHEVLPTIRKTGTYSAKPMTSLDILVESAKALQLHEQRLSLLEEALEVHKAEVAPKVAHYDQCMASEGFLLIREVAKVLNFPKVGEHKLYAILRDDKVLMKNNEPYQTYVEKNWFRVFPMPYTKPDGTVGTKNQTKVSQKGIDGLRKRVHQWLQFNDVNALKIQKEVV